MRRRMQGHSRGGGASQHRTLTVAPSNIACNSLIVVSTCTSKAKKTCESLGRYVLASVHRTAS